MSAVGKPSEDNPRSVARAIGLDIPSGVASWSSLVDAAVEAYWTNRPEPSKRTATERRRRRERAVTPPEVWVRRAGAA